MALKTSYGPGNRVVTKPLHTEWECETKTELMHIGSGHYLYFRWIEYTRIRTKSYRYFGMTEAAARACAAEVEKLYNRKLVPQEWSTNGVSGEWHRMTPVAARDYDYKKCANVSVTQQEGAKYAVEVQVDERLVYRHTALNVSGEAATDRPERFTQFELDPESQSFDRDFGAVGLAFDYEED